jgi:hypothetical protein
MEVFGGCGQVFESEILGLIETYFEKLDLSLSDRYEILKKIEEFDLPQIGQGVWKAFKGEESYLQTVAVGVDVKEIEKEFFNFSHTDPWKLKSYKERLFKERIVPNLLNIKKSDLDACGAVFEYSEIFGIYYIAEYEGLYDKRTGFLIQEEQKDYFD